MAKTVADPAFAGLGDTDQEAAFGSGGGVAGKPRRFAADGSKITAGQCVAGAAHGSLRAGTGTTMKSPALAVAPATTGLASIA